MACLHFEGDRLHLTLRAHSVEDGPSNRSINHLLKWSVVCETKTETRTRKKVPPTGGPTGAAPLGSVGSVSATRSIFNEASLSVGHHLPPVTSPTPSFHLTRASFNSSSPSPPISPPWSWSSLAFWRPQLHLQQQLLLVPASAPSPPAPPAAPLPPPSVRRATQS